MKNQRHQFADKGPYNQSYGFSSSHVWIWELDHKEGWTPKNWCFRAVVLDKKTLESPLNSKEIKPVNPKGTQLWIVIERTDAEAEPPILWPPDMNSPFIGKNSNAGNDWKQRRRGRQKMDLLKAFVSPPPPSSLLNHHMRDMDSYGCFEMKSGITS